MPNPFTLRFIPPRSSFCNRTQELRELSSHASNRANVVLFSPRRYGKTSLVKQVQAGLEKNGFFTFYTDFFMVTSVNDIAGRIAKNVYSVLHRHESLLKKGARYLKTFKTFRPVFKPAPHNGFALTVEPVSTELSGIDLLDKVLEELGVFIRSESAGAHIVFDEFQEIAHFDDQEIERNFRSYGVSSILFSDALPRSVGNRDR